MSYFDSRPKKWIVRGILGTLFLIAAAPAFAQRGYRPYRAGPQPRSEMARFRHQPHGYVGANLTGMGIISQVTDYRDGYLGSGAGGGLFAGFRLTPFFAIEGNWMATAHDETFTTNEGTFIDLDSIYLMTFTVDGKLFLPSNSAFEPYLQAGIGYALAGVSYTTGSGSSIFSSGVALNAGGGADIWLTPWVTIGGRVLYRGLYMGDPNYDGRGERYTNFVSGVSFDIGAALHF